MIQIKLILDFNFLFYKLVNDLLVPLNLRTCMIFIQVNISVVVHKCQILIKQYY
jgi:hypothetical protein